MSHKLACSLLIVFAFVFSAENRSNANEHLVLKKQTFHDPGSNNMPSHTMLVPDGWKAEGSAWWANVNYFNNLPSQEIQLNAPDGSGIVIGPSIMANDFRPGQTTIQYGVSRPRELQSDNGLVVLYRPDNFDGWKAFYEQKVIANEDPGKTNQRIVEIVEIPVLTQAIAKMMTPLRQQIEQGNQLNRQMGFEQLFECGGLGISVEYMQDGRRFERLHLLGIISTTTTGPMGLQINWGTTIDVAYFAPLGQLKEKMPQLMAISNSLRATNEWSAMVSRHQAKMHNIAMDGMRKRHQIHMQTMNHIREMYNDSNRNYNETMDRAHERFSNYIRGVDVYEQNGYSYELPNDYNYVYGDGLGNFVMTDDALYKPGMDFSGTWSSLSPRR